MLRIVLLVFMLTAPLAAQAEVELSFYGGWQTAPHSAVTIGGDAVVPDSDFTAGWDGRSFAAPPYYGVRATWWRSETFGFGLDGKPEKFGHGTASAATFSVDVARNLVVIVTRNKIGTNFDKGNGLFWKAVEASLLK